MTNALKHAPGAPISIEVERSPDRLRAVVTNGPATPVTDPREPALRRSGGGYGLEGMRGRVEALGGTLAAGPDAGGGWAVEALVPVAPASLTSITPVATRSEAHHRAPVHGNMNTNAENPRRLSRFAPGSGRVSADAAQPGGRHHLAEERIRWADLRPRTVKDRTEPSRWAAARRRSRSSDRSLSRGRRGPRGACARMPRVARRSPTRGPRSHRDGSGRPSPAARANRRRPPTCAR